MVVTEIIIKIYQNEGAEWRILVPGCVDFLGRMWTARLLVCLCVCLSAWVGRGPPTHPLLGKGGKASQATHPATHPSGDPPQRPTLVLIAIWRVLGILIRTRVVPSSSILLLGALVCGSWSKAADPIARQPAKKAPMLNETVRDMMM